MLLSSLALLGGCTQPATNEQSATTNRTAAASPAPGQTNAGPTATPTTPAPKGDVDPCSLLTSAELQAVQGEPLKETKASAQAAGGLLNLQCFYTLPTFSNSVSLTVTEKDPTAAAGRTAKQFWEDNFGEWEKGERGSGKEQREKGRGEKTKESGEKEKERGGREAGGREEEEERGAPPVRVPGLGDEAFWSANRVGGALYVLKGERFFMLSVGGKGDGDEKLKKAKALARDALRHL
ncbi:MAG TPA: hypothetical protein VJ866_06590 [Pyrinomonadaceae bacterium]|nr:hypothetical protein [Pyrinomonadaceae bacterium]